MSGRHWTRRKVLGTGAAAAAGAVAARHVLAQEAAEPKASLEFRTLGRTGLKVTTVGVGCMVTPEPVIAKALDMGINWFDTAHSYKRGTNEGEVGRVFKGKRDKGYICTKLPKGSTEEMLSKLDISLERLQTDHVELLLTHGASRRDDVFNEDVLAALDKAKQAGKTRFIGFSTHRNMAECINAAVEAKVYDAVVTKYGYSASPDELTKAIADAAKAGVGIIAMKTQQGGTDNPEGGLTPHQAMLKWALDNTDVAVAIPGMREFQHLEEDFAVMGKRLSYLDRLRLNRYTAATAAAYCTACGACTGACPHGVDIPEVRRCAMYLDVYRDEPMARESYTQIAASALACSDCANCTARCVRGAQLRKIMRETHAHLA